MSEEQKILQESIDYFDNYINETLKQALEGVSPIEVVKHYNIVRAELAKIQTLKN
jgi:hypothetical protein